MQYLNDYLRIAVQQPAPSRFMAVNYITLLNYRLKYKRRQLNLIYESVSLPSFAHTQSNC